MGEMGALTGMLRHILLDFRQMQDFIREPFIVARADGIRYWDVTGKEYLDGLSGVFVVNAGHNNRAIIEAMKAQLDRVAFAPPLHGVTPPAVELASRLAEIAPGDLNTVKLLSGGSEAMETALKIAWQYHRQTRHPRKHKIVSMYHAYHGATLGALSATATRRRKAIFEPLLSGFVHAQPVYCFRCPYEKTYPACDVFCARTVRDLIEGEDPETVAAVIVEPISNTGGTLVPPPEYLPTLRRICDETGALLIFDEIITGFGRTGELFAAIRYQTTPDILVVGKGMSSGYAPLAAVVISDRVAQAFWGKTQDRVELSHGHTYGAHPVAAAAGLASIGEILGRDLSANARKVGAHLKKQMAALSDLAVIADVRGEGLMVAAELATDPKSNTRFDEGIAIGNRVAQQALRNGLVMRGDLHTISLAPPLIVTEKEIDAMVAIVRRSLQEVLAELRA
jgi:adenosylmethionine-8-amino-7-oxononanoate aminotransferase